LVIRSRQEVEEQSEGLRLRLARAIRYRLLIGKQSLTELAQHGAFGQMISGINQRQQKLDDLIFRAEKSERKLLEQKHRRLENTSAAIRHYDVRRILSGMRKELEARTATLNTAVRTRLQQRSSRLEQLVGQIQALSPLAILERGYALIFDSSGKLLKDAAEVTPGDEVSATLARGTFTATVKSSES
jgi:exodeoxyribonuclease VII large subunit